MEIRLSLGSNQWSLILNKPILKRIVKPVVPSSCVSKDTETSHRRDYCLKCGCILFPEETMCPDCLFPVRHNEGWTV